MKILVTGGGGFIGNALAKKLIYLNHDVTVIDFPEKLTQVFLPNCTYIGGDLSLDSTLDNLELQFDFIYHIAAQSSGYIGLINSGYDIDCNVKSTVNVFKYAKKTGVKKVIYTSSMSVYGNGENFTETSKIDPTSHYGISKYTGELYCNQYTKLGVNHTIFRLFNVYGYGQDMSNLNQGMVSIYLAQSLKGSNILVKGSFDRFRDFIYIDDVVEALLLGLDERTDNELYNVCSGRKTTVKELLDIIVAAHKVDRNYFTLTNIGEYEGDQTGASGNSTKLKGLGWSVSTTLEQGINKFLKEFK